MDIYAHHANQLPVFETQCFYRQLHMILACILPANRIFGPEPMHWLFAVVQPCEMHVGDTTFDHVTYTRMQPSTKVIELTAITCTVG